ncbi:hypothetical protein LIER_41619 [Lithospermum erythrorhizon]|uniref:Nuclease HARBI1 n=1 Tax=Lithospermum erythrorhizon TaxID=34254 RepID=A0AAV3RFD4_LITER
MHQKVFMRIVNDLSSEYQHFSLRHDAAKSVGLSPIQKCTAGIRMFAYGMPGDACDEYVKISASTIIEFLKQFCKEVIHLYEGIYLRKPNAEDLERLLRVVEDHGFPGMISSIDCMHWEWRNYPVGWQGQFRGGHHGAATIILEAVASFDIWHAFFGLPSTLNDINVLDRSPVFDFRARWPTFIQSIRNPQGEMEKLFMERHETYRKHVERAFGVLQSRFQIIQESARLWDLDDLSTIMRTCIILHNMIVEDERATYGYNQGVVDYEQPKIDRSSSAFQYTTNNDLIPHIWQNFGFNQI